jgi:hypothetical protein
LGTPCSDEFSLLGRLALSCSLCLLHFCHQAQAFFLRLFGGGRCRLLCHLLGNAGVFLLDNLKPRLLAFMEMLESLQPVVPSQRLWSTFFSWRVGGSGSSSLANSFFSA